MLPSLLFFLQIVHLGFAALPLGEHDHVSIMQHTDHTTGAFGVFGGPRANILERLGPRGFVRLPLGVSPTVDVDLRLWGFSNNVPSGSPLSQRSDARFQTRGRFQFWRRPPLLPRAGP